MRRTRGWALLLLFFLSASGAAFGVAGDPASVLKSYLARDGSDRLSGKGQYIRHVYRRKVTLEELAPGVHFESQKHGAAFAALLKAESGIELGLDEDQNEYSLERMWFEGGTLRRESVPLASESEAQVALSGGLHRDGVPLTTYVYDGTKTIALTQRDSPSGPDNVATINAERVWMPPFRAFGVNDGGERTRGIREALDQGTMSVVCSSVGKELVVQCGLENTAVGVEIRLLPKMGGVLKSARMFMGDRLVTETLCDDYFRSGSGDWCPGTYTTRKYAEIDGEMTLTYSESYEAIDGSVDFNLPLESELFELKLPPGTHVMDIRGEDTLEFVHTPNEFTEVDVDIALSAIEAQETAEPQADETRAKETLPISRREPHRAGRISSPVPYRSWLYEWGWCALVVVILYAFMFWLAYRKRRAQRKDAGEV